MPAVASVLRGKTSLPSWLASIRSRLSIARSKSGSSSRTEAGLSYQSGEAGTGVWPLDEAVIAGNDRAGDGVYLRIYDGRREGDYELRLVTTEIRGPTDARGTLEEGVEAHQSTREARPAA